MALITPPRFIAVITRDSGAFWAVLGPPILGAGAFVVYLIQLLSGNVTNGGVSDIAIFIATIVLSGTLFMPAVLWWYYIIRRTYKEGAVLEAKIKTIDKRFPLNIGVTCIFEHNGQPKEAIIGVVNTRKSREILAQPTLTILFDAKRNLSFIKEVFA